MKLYTIRNDFHNSKVRVRCEGLILTYEAFETVQFSEVEIRPNRRQLKRIRAALCGFRKCSCGGIRGPQTTDDGRRLVIVIDRTAE